MFAFRSESVFPLLVVSEPKVDKTLNGLYTSECGFIY